MDIRDTYEEQLLAYWKKVVSKDLRFDETDLMNHLGGLYHYTNSAGLLGILSSNKFWATESEFLNDSREVKHGLELAETIVNELHTEVQCAFSQSILNETKEEIYKYNGEIYIACFSEEGDLLSQWKGYGDYGKGYAIKLDHHQLFRQKRKFPFVKIEIKKVVYEEVEQVELIRSQLQWILECTKSTRDESPELEELLIGYAARWAANVLRNMACRFKDRAFSEEKEWRAIYSNQDKSEEGPQPIQFRLGDGGVIPYMELDICPSAQRTEWHLPISEVVIGAKNNFELAEKTIMLLCKRSNIPKPIISRSKIPLR
ncbi:DUF2971 domain-containing protein [Rheinheimera sp.]|uniref:DUF2971 domain-containing protein n=1 Tax=Rheinheimera sp. TaxID=1869214 RepID=UPI0026361FBC|nr:DUF2971 domain-containing protein [Rheinheimera sp.]MCA1928702.1 DUF2971 domain-containing protein [Rheinheimera sp.]